MSETVETWNEVAPGVWSCRIGIEDYSLLDAAGAQPRHEALASMAPAAFPLDAGEIRVERRPGKLFLRFPLEDGEAIYGLGLDFNGVRRNQAVQTLHVDAWGGRSGRTHAPVPFYLSSRGYGVLIDSARYLTFYVGTGVRTDTKHPPVVYDRNTDRQHWQSRPKSDNIEVYVPAEGVEVLIFGGPTPMAAVQRYNLYCGGGCLPPKWGLGFSHRTPTLYTQEQVREEAAEFERRGFPLDVIGLEPGWHDHAYPCSFEWDRTRFPDPAGLIAALHAAGVHVNLWFNPYVAPGAPLYSELRPHSGSHTVWNGIVPDYTLPEPRRIFADHLRQKQLSLGGGVGGFKIDEVDGHDHWLWPDVATFPSGLDAEQLRQSYGLLLQRLTLELFRAENRRTYGLVRGSNAGASPLPYVLYSDSYSFEGYLTALCNSGFCGLLWTPEVRSAKSAEEWVRRIQAVCFSPLAMLNAWASGTKPWSYAEVAEPVREVMLLRMRLLPYFYTTFAQYHFQGTPPIRPMPLLEGFAPAERREGTVGSRQSAVGSSDAPSRLPTAYCRLPTGNEAGALDDTTNPYEVEHPIRCKDGIERGPLSEQEARVRDLKDQFMLGDSLLVAPMPFAQETRTVLLPRGKWFDFYTGDFAGDGEILTVAPPLDRIPLFVRDGGLLPLLPERLHAPRATDLLPLEVHHYGEAAGELLLYDDDGETFDYERGAYTWTRLRASRDAAGHWQGEVLRDDAGKPFHYGEVTWRFRTE